MESQSLLIGGQWGDASAREREDVTSLKGNTR